MRSFFICSFFIAFLLYSCRTKEVVYEIDFDKELIPEGITIDPKTGKIYLSSIHKQKIIEYDPGTGLSKNFIGSRAHGYKRGMGITVKGKKLFALGSEPENAKGSSILLVFDLPSKQLLRRFRLKDTVSHTMNDLAVGGGETIFITDTERHLIYELKYPVGEIVPFLEHEEIQYPNGITISKDNTKLFVDSWTSGIRIIDVTTKKILNPRHKETTQLGIDGLKYHDGNLYAIRNGGQDKSKHGLLKIELSEDEKSIMRVIPLLLDHPAMDIPTTFCIEDHAAYVLANSQLLQLDQKKNRIINKDSLTNTFIIKHPLK